MKETISSVEMHIVAVSHAKGMKGALEFIANFFDIFDSTLAVYSLVHLLSKCLFAMFYERNNCFVIYL